MVWILGWFHAIPFEAEWASTPTIIKSKHKRISILHATTNTKVLFEKLIVLGCEVLLLGFSTVEEVLAIKILDAVEVYICWVYLSQFQPRYLREQSSEPL
jgi:hypothetical protein